MTPNNLAMNFFRPVLLLALGINGASIKSKDLSGFEIFQLAFQHGRSFLIKELSFEPQISPSVLADLSLYLNQVPMDERGWRTTWYRWLDEYGFKFGWENIKEDIENYTSLLRLLMKITEFPDMDQFALKLQNKTPEQSFQKVVCAVVSSVVGLWFAFSIFLLFFLVYDTISRLGYS